MRFLIRDFLGEISYVRFPMIEELRFVSILSEQSISMVCVKVRILLRAGVV